MSTIHDKIPSYFSGKKILLLIFLSVLTCTTLVFISSTFTVKNIHIEGEHDVRGVEQYYGRSMLIISPDNVIQNLKENNARIADIVIEKIYPDTLYMHMTVKRPSVEVKLADGYITLAADGHILEKVKQRLNEEVPLIQYYQPLFYNQYHVGDTFDNNDIRVATAVSGSMLDLGVKVRAIDIASENMIVLHSEDFDVFTTSEKDADTQFREFEYTYKQLKIEGTKFSSIDVRFEKPIIKLL